MLDSLLVSIYTHLVMYVVKKKVFFKKLDFQSVLVKL